MRRADWNCGLQIDDFGLPLISDFGLENISSIPQFGSIRNRNVCNHQSEVGTSDIRYDFLFTFHVSRFTFHVLHNAATLNDWAEITELATAKILVEIESPLLFFGGGGDEADGLLGAEELGFNSLRDVILL